MVLSTDLRHAFRLLWKSKGITATTLVTLALGIGATTAIFSTVYSLMLKPLPFQEPERIVELYSSAVKAGLNHMPATSRSISIIRRTRPPTRALGCGRSFTAWSEKRILSSVPPAYG